MIAPLRELQVVDLTRSIAGAYCTKLFVDAGADVVLVEPAGGHPLRRYAATTEVPSGQDGALFQYLAAGKQSIIGTLDDRLHDLLTGADLLVEDLEAVDMAELRARHPHLVVCSITPFGRSGPLSGRPASELTLQCESGAILFRGPVGRPPVQAGGLISDYMAGVFAAAPALAAVLRARDGGGGEHVDVSIQDVMAVAGSNYSDVLHCFQGRPEVRDPMRILDTPGIERARDGLVGFNTNAGHMFQMFLLMIGRPDLMEDPRYASLAERVAMGDEWQKLIDDWVGERTVEEVIQEAVALRVPVGPVHDGASIARDEQLAAREVFARDEDGLLAPRPPYRIDGYHPRRAGRAPALGEHDDAVAPRPPRDAGAPTGALPLAGVRVIDLTSWWVGALASQHLAMLGADVIHVEGTAHPDGMRLTGHFTARSEEWWEWGHMFTAANAGKRGITLDLATDEGRDLLRRLIAGADVLVENFAPRVVESWGLDHDAVLALNPGIVYLRMPAFGLTGPWRDRPAFAQIIEPMSTMASITGYPDGLPVSKGGLPDPVTGATGAWVAMLGLTARRARGTGVALESVMLEATVNVVAQPGIEFDAYGRVMGRDGNRSPVAAPQGLYRAADGRWVGITVADDEQWRSLVGLLGGPAWADDPVLDDLPGRQARHDELDRHLGDWVATMLAADAAQRLVGAGVVAGLAWDPRGVSRHPQLVARGLYQTLDHPVVGDHDVPGATWRYASVERWLDRAAPTMGQHNAEVLAELDLSDEEIADLTARGVIGERPARL